MKRVARLCGAFPETALRARRLLEKRARGYETSIRKGHEFDAAPLLAYLHPLVGSPKEPGDVRIGQFSHGQSNPTFTVRWDGGAVVVRKKPKGALLRGAHDVAREHAFASHLRPLGVPTPVARALCEDRAVLGTDFWVYDYVQGRHFTDLYLQAAPHTAAPHREVCLTLPNSPHGCRRHRLDFRLGSIPEAHPVNLDGSHRGWRPAGPYPHLDFYLPSTTGRAPGRPSGPIP